MNDLELLRPAVVFASVVEEGSFRAAADRLGLSAPYVSQLVADLEARLGRQLLYRTTRKLALSADGERFLPVAQQIAGALTFGLGQFRADTNALVGRLRLSVPTVLAAPVFSRIVAEFQRRNPQLELVILMDDQPNDPLDQQTDLSIRIGRPGDDTRPGRKLFETYGIVCAAPDIAAQLTTPEALTRHRWIKTPAMQTTLTLTNSIGIGSASVTPPDTLVTNNGKFTAQLVAENAGWAVFPFFAVRETIAAGHLTYALPEWHLPGVGVYCLYSARQSALSNAKSFVDFLAEKLV